MKRKNLISFIIIAFGIIVLSLLMPWWSSIIWIILICVVMNLSVRSAWWISGIAMALVCIAASAYLKGQDQTDLIGKTGNLLGGVSSTVLLIVTAVIAFISGALAGWFGTACAFVIKGQKTKRDINGFTQSKPI